MQQKTTKKAVGIGWFVTLWDSSGTLMFYSIVIQSWMSFHEEWVKNDCNEESRHYQYWRKYLAW